jgi:glycosyltransferase involved in cell wall biosynthesis
MLPPRCSWGYSPVKFGISNGGRKPPKILHVVENLDRGAVENWLLRMLGHARQRNIEVDWTFYCILEQPGAMDEKAGTLGARVVHTPVPLVKKAEFVRALRAHLRSERYDVLHSHHDVLSAVYLVGAMGMPLQQRIVHVHNADESVPTASRLKRRIYREPMRRVCLGMADRIVGISNHALDMFLGGRARRPGRDLVHYYGVDPTPFKNVVADRVGFRRQCSLSDAALILLFGGRLVPEKNPVFTIDVLAKLRSMDSRVVAVFAGSGSKEEHILQRARQLGVEHAVRMLGWREDLPLVMSCCDWFILPHPEHPMEGFGLAVVEAQLAGLRLLLSRGIADHPVLPTASFRRLALSEGPEVWATAAIELLHGTTPSPKAAVTALKGSPMDMDRALEGLLQLYE